MSFNSVLVSNTISTGPSLVASVSDMSSDSSSALIQLKVLLTTIAIATIPSIALYCQKNLLMTPWLYRALWVGAFLINVVTVSIPGRFDGQTDSAGKVIFPWRTLFEPSGWAFAIWGVIYSAELLVSAYVGAIGTPVSALQRTVPYWLAGNLFQSLWCYCFRPQFKRYLWLPTSCLALAALSLGLGHNALTVAIDSVHDGSRLPLLLIRFPFALHTGWLAAATLLNLNGWSVLSDQSLPVQISIAYMSAYIGAAVGVALSIRSGDPFLGLTVAWALLAVSVRTNQKISEKPLLADADTQRSLSMTERALSIFVGMISIGAAALPKSMF